MVDPDVLEPLRRLPHFATVDRALVERIAAGCRRRSFDAGEAVFREGESTRAWFVVAAGRVRLYKALPDGRRHVLTDVARGHAFAEAAVLGMSVYPVNAEALESPTDVVEVDGDAFLAVFREERALAEGMVGGLCMRLLHLVGRVDELSAVNAAGRLARHLLRLPSRQEGARLVVPLAGTKKDLAAQLSITPETLSRLFRKWGDEGVLKADGKSLELLDVEALETLAES